MSTAGMIWIQRLALGIAALGAAASPAWSQGAPTVDELIVAPELVASESGDETELVPLEVTEATVFEDELAELPALLPGERAIHIAARGDTLVLIVDSANRLTLAGVHAAEAGGDGSHGLLRHLVRIYQTIKKVKEKLPEGFKATVTISITTAGGRTFHLTFVVYG